MAVKPNRRRNKSKRELCRYLKIAALFTLTIQIDMKTKNLTLLFVLGLCSVIGCSKQLKPDGFPPLHPVSIRIIQDGKPLNGATVSLWHNDETQQKWGIFAETDSDGKAVFVTHGTFYGAPEGEYHVVVTKLEDVVVKRTADDAIIDSYTLVEEQYVDRTTTPLRIRVQKKGKNYEEFNVGQPVRIFLEQNHI